ncbi:hypothetical protein [Trinickia mobilis]|uniref:hypothetical protein n=1 Tax=Trinickia mobilis TaxID=2816356 RepID=UPI001A8FDCC9|nr:hypothetical protein [Trinickia mobilis]
MRILRPDDDDLTGREAEQFYRELQKSRLLLPIRGRMFCLFRDERPARSYVATAGRHRRRTPRRIGEALPVVAAALVAALATSL